MPKLHEAARRADVSVSIVSTVLNAPDEINGDTRSDIVRGVKAVAYEAATARSST